MAVDAIGGSGGSAVGFRKCHSRKHPRVSFGVRKDNELGMVQDIYPATLQASLKMDAQWHPDQCGDIMRCLYTLV